MPRAVQLALRLPRARTQEPPWGRWAVDSGVAHCGIHSERECVFFVSKGRLQAHMGAHGRKRWSEGSNLGHETKESKASLSLGWRKQTSLLDGGLLSGWTDSEKQGEARARTLA